MDNSMVIQEYQKVLLGDKKSVGKECFKKSNKLECRNNALTIFRYAIEELLNFTPSEAKEYFTDQLVEALKLDKYMQFIDFPPYIRQQDKCEYIVSRLFKEVSFNEKKKTIEIYKQAIEQNVKLPKNFFGGDIDGAKRRAKYCLKVDIIEHLLPVGDTKEERLASYYQFFADSKNALIWLRKFSLQSPCNELYDKSPLNFFHDSLADSDKRPAMYAYFKFRNYADSYLLKKKDSGELPDKYFE